MCGIFGYVGQKEVDAQRVIRLLKHRGPDGDGARKISLNKDRVLHLVHTRLAILDLSSAGAQPMEDSVRGNIIVFNGEIYNFIELRRELEQLGCVFHSSCDTEVLLQGYGVWGRDVFRRLDGMFACLIYDAKEKRLIVARDHVGIKPLYYAVTEDGGLVFASETRTLVNSGVMRREVNLPAIHDYLTLGSVQFPRTIYCGVYEFPPAHFAEMDLTAPRLALEKFHRYWNLAEVAQPSLERDVVDQHRQMLAKTVQQQLMADVPVGLFLSAGVDSTALAELVCEKHRDLLSSFTLCLENSKDDEGPSAARTANNLKISHILAQFSDAQWSSFARDGLAAMDCPSSDGLNTYLVSRMSKITGIVVALCGAGCDELHGGYAHFQQLAKLHGIYSHPLGKKAIRAFISCSSLKNVWPAYERIRLICEQLDNTKALVNERRRFFMQQDIETMWPEAKKIYLEQNDGKNDFAGFNIQTQIAMCEIQGYLANTLLRDGDWATMANQQELRVPYLGKEYMETVLKIPWKWKGRNWRVNKPLVANLISSLNRHVINRKKTGFNLDYFNLITRHLRDEFQESIQYLTRSFGFALNPDSLVKKMNQLRSPKFDRRMWALTALGFYCKNIGNFDRS